jgi:D-alanyl-D-alanine dipeptidase
MYISFIAKHFFSNYLKIRNKLLRRIKMKKLLCMVTIFSLIAANANAETIMIMDANGNMTQQIYAYPASTQVTVQPQPVAVQPQQVVTVQPYQPQQVVVVRQTPQPRNYYYDSAATSFFAGLTGAVIGGAIFHHHGHHGGRHHHHRR